MVDPSNGVSGTVSHVMERGLLALLALLASLHTVLSPSLLALLALLERRERFVPHLSFPGAGVAAEVPVDGWRMEELPLKAAPAAGPLRRRLHAVRGATTTVVAASVAVSTAAVGLVWRTRNADSLWRMAAVGIIALMAFGTRVHSQPSSAHSW